jgi:hypothetical protein
MPSAFFSLNSTLLKSKLIPKLRFSRSGPNFQTCAFDVEFGRADLREMPFEVLSSLEPCLMSKVSKIDMGSKTGLHRFHQKLQKSVKPVKNRSKFEIFFQKSNKIYGKLVN